MKRLTYILLLIEVLLTGCRQRPDEVDFLVLYTTQMYGNYLPWDFQRDTVKEVSLANFMSLVKEQRAIYGDRCIVLDNGNMHTRSLSNFYWRYLDTICEPLSYKAQAIVGYDAVAMGHSDLRLAEPFLAARHDTLQCPPTICTNLFDKQTGRTFMRPWVLLERDGIRIAIFALVDDDADFWTPRLGHPSAVCKDMVSSMREKVLEMRHICKPDLVIGLISSPRPLEELKIEEQIPGVDHIIGIQLEGGDNRNMAGIVRIHMTRDEETDEYRKQKFTVTADLSQYEIDAEYAQFFDEDIQKIRACYNEEIGQLSDTLVTNYGIYSPHDYYRDLLHQSFLWYSNADISLANIANADHIIVPGPMKIRRLAELFGHENVLVSFRASGREVKQILESYYALQYNSMSSPSDPMLALRHDRKGHLRWNAEGQPYLNVPPARFTSADGIHYTVDLRRQPGDRINILNLTNGKPYHPDSLYSVVTNSYIASGLEYLTYLNWDKYEIRRRLLPTRMPSISYVIYKYFKDCPTAYTPSQPMSCDFIPEEWWRQSKSRELQILNPTW